jgi:plasmid stabilization system protein ParE
MDSKTNCSWTPAAERDVDAIWRHFVEIASVEVADNVLDELERAARLIVIHPFAWRERPDLAAGVRVLRVQPFLLFYRYDGDAPEIIRVLHERRDVTRLLSRTS